MDLMDQLLACGFDAADVRFIDGQLLSGLVKLAVAMGASGSQTFGEVLTEEQCREVLLKTIDDHIARMPIIERERINFGTLHEMFGWS